MPLSDREQEILADIEARLRRDDPRLAKRVASTGDGGDSRAQVRLAAIGFGVGFLLLFGIAASIWFGIVGAGLMLASALFAVTRLRRSPRADAGRRAKGIRAGLDRYLEDRSERETDD